MSQCLNEQPGELLLKSPLKKEGKKRESLSPWKQKNYRNEYCDFPRHCIQEISHFTVFIAIDLLSSVR